MGKCSLKRADVPTPEGRSAHLRPCNSVRSIRIVLGVVRATGYECPAYVASRVRLISEVSTPGAPPIRRFHPGESPAGARVRPANLANQASRFERWTDALRLSARTLHPGWTSRKPCRARATAPRWRDAPAEDCAQTHGGCAAARTATHARGRGGPFRGAAYALPALLARLEGLDRGPITPLAPTPHITTVPGPSREGAPIAHLDAP
jgi:hypothetical protein